METKDVQVLIEAFKGYRDLLTPIQLSLQELADTYSTMEENLTKLGATFNGDAKNKLEEIYANLASQTKKSTDLAANIDQFLKNSAKYSSDLKTMTSSLEELEKSLNNLNEIEDQAKSQMERLEKLIEEKKINYNVRDLQKSLDSYNTNVQKISDFINKDVASVLNENSRKIDSVKKDNEAIIKQIETENNSINELIGTFKSTNQLLQNTVNGESVNEEYIFAILDKWAVSRGVKIKK